MGEKGSEGQGGTRNRSSDRKAGCVARFVSNFAAIPMSADAPSEGEPAAERGVDGSGAQITMDEDDWKCLDSTGGSMDDSGTAAQADDWMAGDLVDFDSTGGSTREPASPVRRALEAPIRCPDMPIAEALRALRSQLLDHGLPYAPSLPGILRNFEFLYLK